MVWHEGCFPHLHLWVECVDLRQLLFEDEAAQRAGHQVGKVCCPARGAEIAGQRAQERGTPIDDYGDHVYRGIFVVLPVSSTVLARFDVIEGDAFGSFLVCGHGVSVVGAVLCWLASVAGVVEPPSAVGGGAVNSPSAAR